MQKKVVGRNLYSNIMNILLSKGISIEAFCKGSNITKSTFYRWRDSNATPHNEVIYRIAKFLDCSIDSLTSEETTKSTNISNSFNNNINSNINSNINNEKLNISTDEERIINLNKAYSLLSEDKKNKIDSIILNMLLEK